MPPHALPLDPPLRLGQRRRGEPPHTKGQGQRVANDQPLGRRPLHMAERARAVGNAGIQDPAVVRVDVVLGRRVQQDVHVRADVQVAVLQRAGEREHERDVLGRGRGLAHRLDVGRGPRGQAAGERRVGVDVELEQVEEGVIDHGDGAVLLLLDAVVELEGLVGLLAGGEGDPFDLVVFRVLDVLARIAV